MGAVFIVYIIYLVIFLLPLLIIINKKDIKGAMVALSVIFIVAYPGILFPFFMFSYVLGLGPLFFGVSLLTLVVPYFIVINHKGHKTDDKIEE